MKRGRSTGDPTIAQRQRIDAIAERGGTALLRTFAMLNGVRAKFWDTAGENRRAA